MKDFKHFGIKRRFFPENNYNAFWYNLKTTRFGEGVASELEPDKAEFYDVGIGTKCNAGCDFCYVSAGNEGECYDNICETWEKWMSLYYERNNNGIIETDKPFQIAIGSSGEPTVHTDFCDFLETVYNTNVVPNYTTNGIILSYWDKPGTRYYLLANKILEYTKKYVGGVAISFGNKSLRKFAKDAVNGLIEKGDANINLHHIISTKESVDEFIEIWKEYDDKIAYHVLLPLMPSGRSTKSIEDGVFEYLEKKIEEYNIKNVAFGAHFIKYLENAKIKTWLYPAESLSKNVILTKDKVQITPSSFDMNPIKVIEL
jgi:MoaA/NifB/PqqE/SkfB family radical SAM enzyme